MCISVYISSLSDRVMTKIIAEIKNKLAASVGLPKSQAG